MIFVSSFDEAFLREVASYVHRLLQQMMLQVNHTEMPTKRPVKSVARTSVGKRMDPWSWRSVASANVWLKELLRLFCLSQGASDRTTEHVKRTAF
jgi:hypothetical protein